MNLIELFRKHAESLPGNGGNDGKAPTVTAVGHATQGGNDGNGGNDEINRDEIFFKKIPHEKVGVYCYRVTDKPKSILVMVAPESDLNDAWESLRQKYGDRLIEVFVMPDTQH